MKGFKPPDYTAQINYNDDRPEELRSMWGDRDTTYERCAQIVAKDTAVDFVLLVRGRLKANKPASNRDIVADFQPYKVPNAKIWTVET
jgi:hypothetical protein